MEHIIVFAYVISLLIGVATLTKQWTIGYYNPNAATKVYFRFLMALLGMNLYDFFIFYNENILRGFSRNYVLSFGDLIIAVLIFLWIKFLTYGYADTTVERIRKAADLYIMFYIGIWVFAMVFLPEQFILRLFIDIPLIIILFLGSGVLIYRSSKGTKDKKLLSYGYMVALLMGINYGVYFLSEGESVLSHDPVFGLLVDYTILIWVALNLVNFFFVNSKLSVGLFNEEMRTVPRSEKEEPIPSDLDGIKELSKEYGLTAREIDLVEKLYDGKNNSTIAEELFISERTVKAHLYNIYKKLGAKNRIEVIKIIERYLNK